MHSATATCPISAKSALPADAKRGDPVPVLPDRLRPGLTVVFCGTAAGHASARRGHYYAGPGNRFWALLAETAITPRRLLPEEDHLAESYGIGLTDLAKDASGMDRDIPRGAFTPARLIREIAAQRPAVLAFTSLTAARLALGRAALGAGEAAPHADLAGIRIWALPSPSGAARGSFSPEPWHRLGQQIAMLRGG